MILTKVAPAIVIVALLSLGLVDAGDKPDAERIVGTWQVGAAERRGKQLEGGEKGLVELMQLTFTKDRATIGPVGQVYQYTLDTSKKPKQITLTREDKSESIQGIYAFEGELLKLCISNRGGADARPTAFATKNGDQHALLILNRADRPKAVTEAVAQLSEAANRSRSSKNLRYIAIGLHNHHSDFEHFPGAATGMLGQKGQLSWRVAILPYLEQDALFKQFKPDEPWDSEHNKKLIEKMPKIYELTGKQAERGQTFYRAFTGKGTMFENPAGQRIADVTDGTSSTLFVVESADPVIWTKPDELEYAADKPLPKLGGYFKESRVFHAVFADASVHAIRQDVAENTLRPFITRNGGEVVDLKVLAPKK